MDENYRNTTEIDKTYLYREAFNIVILMGLASLRYILLRVKG